MRKWLLLVATLIGQVLSQPAWAVDISNPLKLMFVADTEENRPYERARDARSFARTGDLSIPASYGAEFVVVDRLRSRQELDLPVVFEDERFTLYRLTSPA